MRSSTCWIFNLATQPIRKWNQLSICTTQHWILIALWHFSVYLDCQIDCIYLYKFTTANSPSKSHVRRLFFFGVARDVHFIKKAVPYFPVKRGYYCPFSFLRNPDFDRDTWLHAVFGEMWHKGLWGGPVPVCLRILSKMFLSHFRSSKNSALFELPCLSWAKKDRKIPYQVVFHFLERERERQIRYNYFPGTCVPKILNKWGLCPPSRVRHSSNNFTPRAMETSATRALLH